VLTKVCGLTRAEDVDACEGLGIDLLGFIFHPPSPRNVEPEQVAGFPRGRALRVGVFVRQLPEDVLEIMDRSGLDLAQLHGGYNPSDCRRIGRDRVIKTFWPMGHSGPKTFVQELEPFAASCRYLLLDSGTSGGGHGQATTVPWLPGTALPRPWILAGGLGPETVFSQLRELSPHGVDLNSGVESSPGIKDAGLIRKTLEKINQGVECGNEKS
jgi:phosphoribosylanthranilate isomerase